MNTHHIPRSSGEIQNQITDLKLVLDVAEKHGTPDFASTLGMKSIQVHLDSLLRELCDAEEFEFHADAALVSTVESTEGSD